MQKQKHFRRTAILLLVCFVLAFALSSFFVATNADHDCIGDDCPVCAELSACVSVLRTIGGAAVLAAVIYGFLMALLLPVRLARQDAIAVSPVVRKVRLNN